MRPGVRPHRQIPLPVTRGRSLGRMRRALLNREAVPMMNDVPPSGTISVRIRLLSVTGLAVVASLLIWHSQLSGLLDRPSGADEQPVVSGSGVPRGTAPPVSIS